MTWSAKLAWCLSVSDAGKAVDFYKSAFGAVEPERLEGDVGVLQVARLGIGEADFWVQFDPGGNPHALGGSPPVRMILTVDDPRRPQGSEILTSRCGLVVLMNETAETIPRRTVVAAAVATRAADSSLLARGARRSRLRCGRSSL